MSFSSFVTTTNPTRGESGVQNQRNELEFGDTAHILKQWSIQNQSIIQKKSERIADLETQLQGKELEIDRLKETVHEFGTRHRKNLEMIQESESVIQSLKMKTGVEMHRFNSIVDRLSATYEGEITRLQLENENLQKQSSSTSSTSDKLNDLNHGQQISNLQQRIDALQKERDLQDEELRKMKNVIDRVNSVKGKQEKQGNVINHSMQRMQRENEKLKQQLKNSESTISEMRKSVISHQHQNRENSAKWKQFRSDVEREWKKPEWKAIEEEILLSQAGNAREGQQRGSILSIDGEEGSIIRLLTESIRMNWERTCADGKQECPYCNQRLQRIEFPIKHILFECNTIGNETGWIMRNQSKDRIEYKVLDKFAKKFFAFLKQREDRNSIPIMHKSR